MNGGNNSMLFFKRLKRKKISLLHQQQKKIDTSLLLAVILTCLIGLLFIFEASSVSSLRTFGDKYRFLKDQSLWFGLGLLALFFFINFDYHRLYNFSLPVLGVIFFLLLLVFVPGLGVKALGAHRWIKLGPFVLQPAELTKLGLILYLSAWFSNPERRRLSAFLILMISVVGLVVIEPDLGTGTIICLIAIFLYFLSRAPLWHFGLLVPLLASAGLILAVVSPYRFRRLTTFLNPENDPLGASYHIRQVLLGLGSGGLLGVGIGKSRQKFEFLPEATTDSIFAIIAEELGFLGGFLLLLLFCFILWRGVRIALLAPDKFGHLLAAGITFGLGISAMINLGAMVALIPLTGVPLPLISYGGSSLVVTMAGMGILLNISRQCLGKRA